MLLLAGVWYLVRHWKNEVQCGILFLFTTVLIMIMLSLARSWTWMKTIAMTGKADYYRLLACDSKTSALEPIPSFFPVVSVSELDELAVRDPNTRRDPESRREEALRRAEASSSDSDVDSEDEDDEEAAGDGTSYVQRSPVHKAKQSRVRKAEPHSEVSALLSLNVPWITTHRRIDLPAAVS